MNDPFAWQDEVEEPAATAATAVEPVYDGSDPMLLVNQQRHIPPSPVGGLARPQWDAKLVIDYVLGASTEAICEEYHLTYAAWERIQLDVGFMGKVAALRKELEKDGATFALKAKLQAEVLLDESFKMAMNTEVDDRVRAKLIADTVRWAGFDKSGSVADGTGGFSININLNGKRLGDTFDGEAVEV